MNAVLAFSIKKEEIDHILARIQQSSDDHFGADPEALNWADVGSLDHILDQLKEVSDQLFCEGEYAEVARIF